MNRSEYPEEMMGERIATLGSVLNRVCNDESVYVVGMRRTQIGIDLKSHPKYKLYTVVSKSHSHPLLHISLTGMDMDSLMTQRSDMYNHAVKLFGVDSQRSKKVSVSQCSGTNIMFRMSFNSNEDLASAVEHFAYVGVDHADKYAL